MNALLDKYLESYGIEKNMRDIFTRQYLCVPKPCPYYPQVVTYFVVMEEFEENFVDDRRCIVPQSKGERIALKTFNKALRVLCNFDEIERSLGTDEFSTLLYDVRRQPTNILLGSLD